MRTRGAIFALSVIGGLGLALAASAAHEAAMRKIHARPRTVRAARRPLSLIVPTLRESAYLPRLLESAILQEEPFLDCVVSDSSPDGDRTSPLAAAYGAKVIHYPKGNISKARNAGAASADGEVLVFCDADVILPPDFTTRVIDALYYHAPGAGKLRPVAVHPKEVIYDSASWNLLWYVPANLLRHANHTARCVAVRRDAFLAIEGYDPDVNPVHGGREDLDLGKRLRASFGLDAVAVLDSAIATSSRRERKFGLKGIENWSTPVRDEVRVPVLDEARR